MEFDPEDVDGRALLRELGTRPLPGGSVVLFLAPPGRIIARFTGSPTKRDLVNALVGASSCPTGSGCCG